MQKVYDFLKSCKMFNLATVEGSQPRVRPFGAVTVYQDRIYLITNHSKAVFAQLQANPQLEISAVSGAKWLRITAEAALDNNKEAMNQMLSEMPGLSNMYSPENPESQVFYLKNATAAFYGMNQDTEIIHF